MRFKSLFAAIILVVCMMTPALAEDSVFSEVRGGVYAHDISFWSFNRESGVDVNGEVLFTSPSFLEAVWAPRPHLGATVNTSGNTSIAYGGLTWEWLIPDSDVFLDLNLGGAAHNGKLNTPDNDRKSFGSSFLFRVGGAIGYNVTEKYNISIQYEHVSNAYLADPNEGMDNVGLRLGYRF
jgi:lipid A 3-O-deacylase